MMCRVYQVRGCHHTRHKPTPTPLQGHGKALCNSESRPTTTSFPKGAVYNPASLRAVYCFASWHSAALPGAGGSDGRGVRESPRAAPDLPLICPPCNARTVPGCHRSAFCRSSLGQLRVGMDGFEPTTCWVVVPVSEINRPALPSSLPLFLLSYIPTWRGKPIPPLAPVFPGCRRFAQSASCIVDGGLHRLAFRPRPQMRRARAWSGGWVANPSAQPGQGLSVLPGRPLLSCWRMITSVGHKSPLLSRTLACTQMISH